MKNNENTTNVKTFTFYTDPGHGWLKVPFKTLVTLGIENDISSYSYMFGQFAYLEEDCDFSKFRDAMGHAGNNFRIVDKQTNNESKIRSYRCYSVTQFQTMPKGIVGEVIEYAGQVYKLTHDLQRRGFKALHVNSGMQYRLPRKLLTSSKLV
jgi:hypothetical protein